MNWASERCKPQLRHESLHCLVLRLPAPHGKSERSNTIVRRSRLNRHRNSFRRRMSREGEIPAWSSAPSCSAESRTAPHNLASLPHRSKFTIKTWPQLLPQMHESGRGHLRSAVLQHRTPLRPAQLSNVMPCEVGPCFANFRHRSRVTIKPCSPSAALRGEAGVSRRYALLLFAAHCFAHPRCALHRSPIVPSSRSKLGLMSASPSW